MDVLLFVDMSTDGTPDFVPVAGQRGASLSMSTEMHSIITKQNLDEPATQSYLAGTKEWSLELDGLTPFDEASFDAFEQAYMDNKKIKVELKTSSKSKYSGMAFVESLEFDFAYDDLGQYSASLLGSGKLEKIVTP